MPEEFTVCKADDCIKNNVTKSHYHCPQCHRTISGKIDAVRHFNICRKKCQPKRPTHADQSSHRPKEMDIDEQSSHTTTKTDINELSLPTPTKTVVDDQSSSRPSHIDVEGQSPVNENRNRKGIVDDPEPLKKQAKFSYAQ